MDSVESLSDDKQWKGGWYQNITLPDGKKTKSTYYCLDEHASRGVEKWKLIEPYMKGETFLDIGCNAGLHLYMASKKFKTTIGIESSGYFMKQCEFILKKFKVKSQLFTEDALDFDFNKLPDIDVTLMANALYWMTFSDEEGFVDNPEERMDDFLRRLSEKTTYLVLVGSEDIDRVGGSLIRTAPEVSNHFYIKNAKEIQLNDRTLNVIYAESRNKKTKGGTGKKK